MSDTERKETPKALASPQECDGCGEWLESAVGMDAYVSIEEFETTEHDEWVFCNWSCFDNWYQAGRAMGMIPGVDENAPEEPQE